MNIQALHTIPQKRWFNLQKIKADRQFGQIFPGF